MEHFPWKPQQKLAGRAGLLHATPSPLILVPCGWKTVNLPENAGPWGCQRPKTRTYNEECEVWEPVGPRCETQHSVGHLSHPVSHSVICLQAEPQDFFLGPVQLPKHPTFPVWSLQNPSWKGRNRLAGPRLGTSVCLVDHRTGVGKRLSMGGKR